ncbi:MAG: TraX family protein, partial [Candidatus Bathyarchaeia archaeon]
MGTPDASGYDLGRELLKWVAIVTMTADHVGVVLYPEVAAYRIVGRMAFPLFAYLLVLGMESTGNMRGYLTRLLLFAAVSQI